MQILDHSVQIETLELLGVVELLAHRIRQRGVPMEHLDIERVRPPVAVPVAAAAAFEGALACALVRLRVHHGLHWRFMGLIATLQSPLPRRGMSPPRTAPDSTRERGSTSAGAHSGEGQTVWHERWA